MKDKTGKFFNKNKKSNHSKSTNIVFKNESYKGYESNESKQSSEINVFNDRTSKEGLKIGKQNEKKKGRNVEEILDHEPEERRKVEYLLRERISNNKNPSVSNRRENVKQTLESEKDIKYRFLNSTLHSISSSAIFIEKKKECVYQIQNSSKLYFKNFSIDSDEQLFNTTKYCGKTARGILFLNKRRKFCLNRLFGKNKCKLNIQAAENQIAVLNDIPSKNLILGVSKSLDTINLCKHLELKKSTSTSIISGKVSLSRENMSSMSYKESKKNEPTDYEMVILFVSRKDQEKISCISCNEITNKEVVDSILSSPQFKKSALSKIKVDNMKKNSDQLGNLENTITDDYISSQIPLSFSDPSREVIKKFSFLERKSVEAKKTLGDEIILGDAQEKSKESPLYSLLSLINSTLSGKDSSGNTEDSQTLSNHPSSSKINHQNDKRVLIDIDEVIEKVKSTTGLKEKLLQLAQPQSLVKQFPIENTDTGEENLSEVFQHPSKYYESNKSIILDNKDPLKLNDLSKNISDTSLKLKLPKQNKSRVTEYDANPTSNEPCENMIEISVDIKNKKQLPSNPVVLVERNIINFCDNIENDESIERTSSIKEKQCLSGTQSHRSENVNVLNNSDHHSQDCNKIDDPDTNKSMEELLYSSFRKPYIPVSKTISGIKSSSEEVGEALTLKASSKKPFDVMIEKMSLINHSFLNENQEGSADEDVKWLTIDGKTAQQNTNEICEFIKTINDKKNDSISFFQDISLNLENHCPEMQKFKHFTEVVANNSMQSSFQYSDSLMFELQFLDTIYTQRLKEAKKLNENFFTNERKKYSCEIKAPKHTDKIPQMAYGNKKCMPNNTYIPTKTGDKTKICFHETEQTKENSETTPLEKNCSLLSQEIDNSKSDTNSKWSFDSYRSTSEFSAMLSNQFKRDYIPVNGKRTKIIDMNESMPMNQNREYREMKEIENTFYKIQMPQKEVFGDPHILHKECNDKITNKEDQKIENFDQNKQKDIVVNIFLSRQDQKGSKISLNVRNNIKGKLDKHSSKISVCISDDSSDEIHEDDDKESICENNGEMENNIKFHGIKEQQKLLLNSTRNSNHKLISEIPECKRVIFPRIYSDFSIENKCNPVTYKYLLPNQP